MNFPPPMGIGLVNVPSNTAVVAVIFPEPKRKQEIRFWDAESILALRKIIRFQRHAQSPGAMAAGGSEVGVEVKDEGWSEANEKGCTRLTLSRDSFSLPPRSEPSGDSLQEEWDNSSVRCTHNTGYRHN